MDKRRGNRIKTCRWLFYISLLQLIVFFTVPALIYPARFLFHIEILAALTFGLIFALYSVGVNICCCIVDRTRRPLYIAFIILLGSWMIWAAVSWRFIERMDYLLH